MIPLHSWLVSDSLFKEKSLYNFFGYKYMFTNEALGRTQIEVFSFKEKSPKIHCLEISAFNSLLYNILEFLSTYTYKSVVFHFVMVCILFSKMFL